MISFILTPSGSLCKKSVPRKGFTYMTEAGLSFFPKIQISVDFKGTVLYDGGKKTPGRIGRALRGRLLMDKHMTNTFRAIGPTTFLSPIPAVLLSCRGTEPGFTRDNMITVAWAGVVNTQPPMISVSIKPQRHSHGQIVQSGAFCLNLVNRSLCRAADFCGVKSGRDVDKFAALGLHAGTLEHFPAPYLEEAPAFLCCRVKERIPLGSHDLFLCAVEEVYVKDSLFEEDGSLLMGKADLISYAHGEYFPLKARPEGFFGYSVASEDVKKRRLSRYDVHPGKEVKRAGKAHKRT